MAKVKAEVNDARSQRVTQDAGRVTEPESRNVFSVLVCVFNFIFGFQFWGAWLEFLEGKSEAEEKKEKYVKWIMTGDRRMNTSILILLEPKCWLGH